MTGTQLVEMNANDLIKADWNYKTDGTDEQIEKLINSIKQAIIDLKQFREWVGKRFPVRILVIFLKQKP